MEKLDKYRQIVRQLLASLAAIGYCESNTDVECQFICDTENDHYQLLDIGLLDTNEFITVLFLLISRMEKFGFRKI